MPNHQTIDKSLKHGIRLLKQFSGVKNVVVGRTENCRHKFTPGRIRIRSPETLQGFSIDGYTGWGIQRFEVYLQNPASDDDRNDVRRYIERVSR